MRYGLIDSGLGALGCAAALLDLDPEAELVLALDPDGMPYGVREPSDVARRITALGAALEPYRPDAIVVACNTASVHALDDLRGRLEPATPVIGTVPAIKPAASTGRAFAVWATVRTTGSPYQRDLIARFAPNSRVTEVACPGFAEAVEAADLASVARAVEAAVAATPDDVADVVLGCTHYPLVADEIRAAFGRPVTLHDSAPAVAAQAVRRAAVAVGLVGAAEAGADPTSPVSRLGEGADQGELAADPPGADRFGARAVGPGVAGDGSSAGDRGSTVDRATLDRGSTVDRVTLDRVTPGRATFDGAGDSAVVGTASRREQRDLAQAGRLVAVIESGRLSRLPERALAYRAGRRLGELAARSAALHRNAG